MNKVFVLIVSKDDSFSILLDRLEEFKMTHHGSEYKILANNKENITIVYNKLIENIKNDGYSHIILMHSDVDLNLDKLYDHIMECSNKYDIMGLCGCEKISISESPLNWFCGSRKFPEFRWGCVSHGELGNHVSYFNYEKPHLSDHQVACIDGLCIIMNNKAIKSGLRFDEKLKFNCYDTQISLEAVLKYKLKVGCLVEKDLKHYSVGKSILTNEFLDEEFILRTRLNLGIPKNSKIENYLLSKRGDVNV